MKRIITFIAIAISFVLYFLDVPGNSTLKLSANDSIVFYDMTIYGIIASLIMLFSIWLIWSKGKVECSPNIAPMYKRIIALLIDSFVLLIILSFTILFPLLVEWLYTSSFQLHFERHFIRVTDYILIFFLLVITIGFYLFYFGRSIMHGQQTVGKWLIGIMVVSTKSGSVSWGQITSRALWLLIAIAIWPFTLYKGRNKQGLYWHEIVSDFKVVMVK